MYINLSVILSNYNKHRKTIPSQVRKLLLNVNTVICDITVSKMHLNFRIVIHTNELNIKMYNFYVPNYIVKSVGLFSEGYIFAIFEGLVIRSFINIVSCRVEYILFLRDMKHLGKILTYESALLYKIFFLEIYIKFATLRMAILERRYYFHIQCHSNLAVRQFDMLWLLCCVCMMRSHVSLFNMQILVRRETDVYAQRR